MLLDIFLFLVLPLILEGILWLIADWLQTHITWKPYKKQYDQATENATPDNFVVLINREEKYGFLFGIVCIAIVAAVGIASALGCYLGNNNLIDALYVGLTVEIVTIPFLFVLIHYYSRKIFVTQDVIVIKSAVIKRRIDVNSITSVREIKLDAHLRLTVHFKRGRLKLVDTALNYDLLKNYFTEKGLLTQSDLSKAE